VANTNDLTAQAHLAAGMQKLVEALRRQFLAYLERKEQEVVTRMAAGQGGDPKCASTLDLSDWLN